MTPFIFAGVIRYLVEMTERKAPSWIKAHAHRCFRASAFVLIFRAQLIKVSIKTHINRRCGASPFTLCEAVFNFMKFNVTALRRNLAINLAPISFGYAQNAEHFQRVEG